MSKRIIALITAVSMTVLCIAACGDDKTSETAETSVIETVEETPAAETTAETEELPALTETQAPAESSEDNADGIPQPGDTYNGHTVDHTEDQPNCDDGSHGTIWIFYTDCEDIDYIEY